MNISDQIANPTIKEEPIAPTDDIGVGDKTGKESKDVDYKALYEESLKSTKGLQDTFNRLAQMQSTKKEEPKKELNVDEEIDKLIPEDDSYEDFLRDPGKFRDAIKKAVKLGIDISTERSVNKSQELFPKVAQSITDQRLAVNSIINEFYAENKDLNTPTNKKLMGFAYRSVVDENPSLENNIEEALKEAAKLARSIIGIDSNAQSHGVLPSKGRTGQPESVQVNDTNAQIKRMIKHVKGINIS